MENNEKEFEKMKFKLYNILTDEIIEIRADKNELCKTMFDIIDIKYF